MRAPFITLALLLLGAPSWSQSHDDARRSLITRATEARDRGALEEALNLARQAEQIRASASLSLAIAEIEQSMQRPLAALGDARACVRSLEADAGARDRARLLSVCGSLVSTIEARVARIAFDVPGDIEGLELRIDGHAVPSEARSRGVEVLAGSVVIDASAPHRRPLHRELDVAPRAVETVAINLDAEPASTPAPRDTSRVAPTPDGGVILPPREAPPASRGAGVGPWIVMGAGLAGVALSGVLFALRESALSERDASCAQGLGGGACGVRLPSQLTSGQEAEQRAVTLTTATYVSLGVGGAALVGGLLWRVLGARAEPPVRVGIAPSEHGAVTSLRVRF